MRGLLHGPGGLEYPDFKQYCCVVPSKVFTRLDCREHATAWQVPESWERSRIEMWVGHHGGMKRTASFIEAVILGQLHGTPGSTSRTVAGKVNWFRGMGDGARRSNRGGSRRLGRQDSQKRDVRR